MVDFLGEGSRIWGGMKQYPYYKKVDYSLLMWGLTIPKEYEMVFDPGKTIKPGKHKKIKIFWDRKAYDAVLQHVKRKKHSPVYQIRWDNQHELLKRLRATFVESYIKFRSQREGVEKKYIRSLQPNEVLILKAFSRHKVQIKPFIHLETPQLSILKRLVEQNLLDLIFTKQAEHLFQYSSPWYSKKDLRHHVPTINVIYYLADSRKKELYIGSAERLGDRVKPGRREIRGWNRFRYDILKSEYSNLLRRVEFHTIRTVASILKSQKKGMSSLKMGPYVLKNRTWSRY